MTTAPTKQRVDIYVWAIRLYKTRSSATAACKGGHVHINGKRAKAGASVVIGDTVRAMTAGGEKIVRVTGYLEKRSSATIARQAYEDITPPPPDYLRYAPVARRDPGSGRPTKKQRREMERFLRDSRGEL